MVIPKDSVSDVLRNMAPRMRTAEIIQPDGPRISIRSQRLFFFAHSEEVDQFGGVTTNDEVNIREGSVDTGSGGNEEIDAFAVYNLGQYGNGQSIAAASQMKQWARKKDNALRAKEEATEY